MNVTIPFWALEALAHVVNDHAATFPITKRQENALDLAEKLLHETREARTVIAAQESDETTSNPNYGTWG